VYVVRIAGFVQAGPVAALVRTGRPVTNPPWPGRGPYPSDPGRGFVKGHPGSLKLPALLHKATVEYGARRVDQNLEPDPEGPPAQFLLVNSVYRSLRNNNSVNYPRAMHGRNGARIMCA
jgi:hypothetical protein